MESKLRPDWPSCDHVRRTGRCPNSQVIASGLPSQFNITASPGCPARFFQGKVRMKLVLTRLLVSLIAAFRILPRIPCIILCKASTPASPMVQTLRSLRVIEWGFQPLVVPCGGATPHSEHFVSLTTIVGDSGCLAQACYLNLAEVSEEVIVANLPCYCAATAKPSLETLFRVSLSTIRERVGATEARIFLQCPGMLQPRSGRCPAIGYHRTGARQL